MSENHAESVIPQWTVGWRMQRALGHAQMSVEQMAQELDVSRGTVSRWLNDRGPVKGLYLRQWALLTGVPFDWLRTGAVPRAAEEGTSRSTTAEYIGEMFGGALDSPAGDLELVA
jgi:transcriptional regulator with XRE-family HTH domain